MLGPIEAGCFRLHRSLVRWLLAGALLISTARADDEEDKDPLTPAQRALARYYASIIGWEGQFESRLSAHDTGGDWRKFDNSLDGMSAGTFRLELHGDGTDALRGMFEWRGKGSVYAYARAHDTIWSGNGEGSDESRSFHGEAPVEDINFSVWLGDKTAQLGSGFTPEKDYLRMKQEGFAVAQVTDGNGNFRMDRNEWSREIPIGPLRWVLSNRGEDIWQVAQSSPHALLFTHEGPGGYDMTRAAEKVRSRVTLFPIYDDLEVEVTIPGYNQWRPLGSIAQPGKAGNALTARAVLKRKTESKAPLPKVQQFRFELKQTSREPGVCLNWPLEAKDDNYDLKLVGFAAANGADQAKAVQQFLADYKIDPVAAGQTLLASEAVPAFSFAIVSDDGQRALLASPPKTPKGEPMADVALESYDFGGRAELLVVCELEDGREIVGKLKDTGETGNIRLPKRTPGDWIAESWRKQNEAMKLPANDDEEKVEGQRAKGDGYTLYEEYRGWVVNGKHVEGNPQRKDLLVYNFIGDPARQGIALFERVSQLRVIERFREGEFPVSRILNGNHREAPHRVDQHGVVMMNTSGFGSSGGKTRGVKDANAGKAWRPKDVAYISIEKQGVYDGIFSDKRNRQRYNLNDRDGNFAYARGVAHELLHSVGVDHHGEGEDAKEFFFQAASDPNNPTHRARFTNVRPNFSASSLATPQYGVPKTMNSFNRGATFTLLWEDTGQDIAEELSGPFAASLAAERARRQANPPSSDPGQWATQFPQYGQTADFWRESKLYDDVVEGHTDEAMNQWSETKDVLTYSRLLVVGKPGEADSGNELCLMRYYFANAYPVKGKANTYYVVRPGANRAGRNLCTSPAGTGTNAPAHAPQSRFGDSSANRGNCFSQICPNDAVPASSR